MINFCIIAAKLVWAFQVVIQYLCNIKIFVGIKSNDL